MSKIYINDIVNIYGHTIAGIFPKPIKGKVIEITPENIVTVALIGKAKECYEKYLTHIKSCRKIKLKPRLELWILQDIAKNHFAVCSSKEVAEKHVRDGVTLHRMRKVK